MNLTQKSYTRVVWIAFLTIIIALQGIVAFGFGAPKSAFGSDPMTDIVRDQAILVATGVDLVGADYSDIALERSYSRAELDVLASPTPVRYSSINNSATKRFYEGKGVYLSSLLGDKTGIVVATATDNVAATVDLSATRSFYPNFADYSGSGNPAENAVEVPAILAFSNGYIPAEAASPESEITLAAISPNPTLQVGQLNPSEINNPYYNRNVKELRLGNPVASILTVNTTETPKSYTRAELLMLPRVAGTVTYSTKGADVSEYVRGVDVAGLTSGLDSAGSLQFSFADGYTPQSVSISDIKSESAASPYILAYEAVQLNGTAVPGDAAGFVDTAKNDASIKGYLRLYHNGTNVAKLVNNITYIPPAGSGNMGYRHTEHTGAPYNISAITGATLTVEGPGVEAGVAIPVGNVEAAPAGDVVTGVYTDVRGGGSATRSYQGINVKAILAGKVSGTGNVVLKEQNPTLVFKNRWRQTVATIPWSALQSASTPVILAWGTANENGTNVRPFVYNLADGADPTLGNEDGCLKLVYDSSDFSGSNNGSSFAGEAFASVAYIYVQEYEAPPGYMHDKAPYDDPENAKQIISFGGSALGSEINFTVDELEDLAASDSTLKHKDEYSLTNTTYWYVNEYEGLKLWDLLGKFGLNLSAYENDNNTKVTFRAWDNYNTAEQFTTAELANPGSFYYYEKAINDLGTDRPTVDALVPPNGSSFTERDANNYPVKSGYPVLLAYGVNQYPYVRTSLMDGYKSGLANAGGSMRVIFGKRDYFHSNGSNQLQRVNAVFAGEQIPYSTHKYNDGASGAYQTLADHELEVEVIRANGTKDTKKLTVGEIEDLLYGSEVSNSQRGIRQEKAYYYHKNSGGGAAIEDLFEGVNLQYLLEDVIKIPGTIGTVTFNDNPATSFSLDHIREAGYNSISGTSNLGAVLAFSENGYPLVASSSSAGYYKNNPNFASKTVSNADGPLIAILPQTSEQNAAGNVSGTKITNIKKITVNLEADKYAHDTAPYDELASNEVTFTGGVKGSEVTLSVGAIESKQTYMLTDTYGTGTSAMRYRGIDLFKLLNDAQISVSAQMSQIIVTGRNGDSLTIPAADIASSIGGKKVLLAYGTNADISALPGDGKPLVSNTSSVGYDADYKNDGGPLKLVVEPTGSYAAKSVIEDVVSIEVEVSAVSGWKHNYGVYAAYKDMPALVVSGSDVKETRIFTVGELEELTGLMVQDDYSLGSIQGIKLWELIRDEVGLKDGVTKPTRLLFNSTDNYPLDLSGEIDRIVSGGINGKPVLVGYGQNGYPLVDGNDTTDIKPGFVEIAGNAFGPLRLIVNDNSGWNEKWLCSIVVGTGDPVKPEISDAVFTINGPKGGAKHTFTIQQLKALAGETSAKYTSGNNEETVKGARLDSLLLAAGIDLKHNYTVTLHTADGYESNAKSQLKDIPIANLSSLDYFVAWEAAGAVIDDTVKGSTAKTKIRYYRNLNDGADGLNNVKNASAITIFDPDSVWNSVEKPNGETSVSVNGVRNIVSAKDGGVYYATTTGLYKYDKDGNFVTDYTPKLAAPFIYDVAEDEKGGLYVTQGYDYVLQNNNKGLAYIAPNGDVAYYDVAGGNLPNNFVQAVEVLPSGDVLIGSFGGLTRFTPSTNTWKTISSTNGLTAFSVSALSPGVLPALSVSVLVQDSQGVWIGFYPDGDSASKTFTSGYAYMSLSGEITFSKVFTPEDYGGDLLADYWVRDIAPDGKGGVYIVRSGSYADLPNVGGRIDHVSKDRKITSYTGVELLPGLKDNATSAVNPEIRRIAVDFAGNIWYATSGLGVYKATGINDKAPEHYYSAYGNRSGANSDNVYALAALPNGTIYADATFKKFMDSEGSADSILSVNANGSTTIYTQAGIKSLNTVTHTYSARNSFTTPDQLTDQSGVRVSDFLLAMGVDAVRDANKAVSFVAEDGLKVTLTVGQIFEERYSFDTSGNKVAAVPAILSFEKGGYPLHITPRLIFGQRDYSEQTKSAFLEMVGKIIVGDDAGSFGVPSVNIPTSKTVAPGDQLRLILPTGSGDEKIYYTLDGSEPTIHSEIYNKKADRWLAAGQNHDPIIVPGGATFTIKAKIIGLGKADGQTVTFIYNVESKSVPKNDVTPDKVTQTKNGVTSRGILNTGMPAYVPGSDVASSEELLESNDVPLSPSGNDIDNGNEKAVTNDTAGEESGSGLRWLIIGAAAILIVLASGGGYTVRKRRRGAV